jgi:hypothetical protein
MMIVAYQHEGRENKQEKDWKETLYWNPRHQKEKLESSNGERTRRS